MLDLMGKEKEDRLKKGKKIFLLVSIIVLSCSIIQAKETNINDAVNGDVAGNASGVNGTSPFNQSPNNNTITIGETGSVAGTVFGAMNDTNSEADVTSNTVVIKTRSDITGNVNGGCSLGKGNAINNKVGIMSGNILESVYGG
jgi:hypothetical protein